MFIINQQRNLLKVIQTTEMRYIDMEKIKYITPEIEITEFETEDIITTSSFEYDEGGIY